MRENSFVRMAATESSHAKTSLQRPMEEYRPVKTAPMDYEAEKGSVGFKNTRFKTSGAEFKPHWSEGSRVQSLVNKRSVSEPYKNQKPSSDDDMFSFIASPPIHVKNQPQKVYASLTIPQYSGSILLPIDNNIVPTLAPVSHVLSKSNKSVGSGTKPFPTIRSNGRIDSLGSFPVNQFVATDYEAQDELDQELNQNLDDESSGSFEIDSGESVELVYSPFFQQPRPILQSNEPKFPDFSRHASQIRLSLLVQPNLFTVDTFQDFMEERLVRWRPSDSQHNTTLITEGLHPYAENNFGKKPAPKKTGSLNIFNWFSSRPNSNVDLEKQEIQTEAYYTAQPATFNEPDSTSNNPSNELDMALRSVALNAKQNSSNSILPRTLSRMAHTNSATYTPEYILDNTKHHNTLKNDNTLEPANNQHSATSIGPSYTPKAIPFSDFELNFNTRHPDPMDTTNGIDSFGNDVLELINGTDNFFTSCLDFFRC